jgi:hypothetical protein
MRCGRGAKKHHTHKPGYTERQKNQNKLKPSSNALQKDVWTGVGKKKTKTPDGEAHQRTQQREEKSLLSTLYRAG